MPDATTLSTATTALQTWRLSAELRLATAKIQLAADRLARLGK
jgi:hypothetical protein